MPERRASAYSRLVDVAGVVERVDVEDVIERIDVDALLDRIDVNRLLDRKPQRSGPGAVTG